MEGGKLESGEVPSLDKAGKSLIKYLGGMEIGDARNMGIEEFQDLMHGIRGEFNVAEENSGVIEGDTGAYTYARLNDQDEVTITRKA